MFALLLRKLIPGDHEVHELRRAVERTGQEAARARRRAAAAAAAWGDDERAIRQRYMPPAWEDLLPEPGQGQQEGFP